MRETTTTKNYMDFWRKKKTGAPNCGNDLKKHTSNVTMIVRMRVKTCEKKACIRITKIANNTTNCVTDDFIF